MYAGAVALAAAAALGLSVPDTQADSKHSFKLPSFVPDGSWPKMPLPSAGDYGTPLVISTSTGKPKPWSTGEVAGTCIDSRDHVFIVTRGNLVNSPETLDSVPAAPVIEFNPAGEVVNAWGDRNILPNGIHGCFIDYQDNVWIAGNGDGIVQKYRMKASWCCRSGRADSATTQSIPPRPLPSSSRAPAATREATPSLTRARRCSISLPTCTSIRNGIR
jgi:hypothetical protein